MPKSKKKTATETPKNLPENWEVTADRLYNYRQELLQKYSEKKLNFSPYNVSSKPSTAVSDSEMSEFDVKFANWKEKTLQYTKVRWKDFVVVSKLLEEKKPTREWTEKKRRYCGGDETVRVPIGSVAYIFKAIRQCVLKRDWHSMTKLLLMLLGKEDTMYAPYLYRMVKLNIFMNPADVDLKLREHFEMLTKTHENKSAKRKSKSQLYATDDDLSIYDTVGP